MAQFPAFPFWTDAYLGDTTHLTTLEHGAYMLLLIAMWRSKQGKILNDDKLLARYTRLSSAQWKKIKPILMEFFDEKNGYLFQGRLTDERNAVKQLSQKQSKKAKARWLKNNNTDDAAGMPEPCRTDASPTPTPTPTPTSKKIYKKEFEEFWKQYPKGRNGNKEKSFTAYTKALTRDTAENIFIGAKAYCNSNPGEYVKGCAAWLNDDRWSWNYDEKVKDGSKWFMG